MRGKNKKFECLECHHCKTRTFKTVTEITEWCGRKSIKPNKAWINNVVDFGYLRLIWCELQTGQYSSHGLSPRDATPRHTANIPEDVVPTNRKKVVVTNQNKDSFINDCSHFVL